MKIRVLLKDPDNFSDTVDEAVRASLAVLKLPKEEEDAIFETRRETVWKKLSKFVDCQEYLDVEFDLEAGTATVLPAK